MCHCVSFLDLRESFHPGDQAGSADRPRRGGAGVRPGALLRRRPRLQSFLEVEDPRRSPGHQIEAAPLPLAFCAIIIIFSFLSVSSTCDNGAFIQIG